MTHDNFRYWRDRMYDKLSSHIQKSNDVFKDLLDKAEHINLKTAGIAKAIKKIQEAYVDLEKAIVASRSKGKK